MMTLREQLKELGGAGAPVKIGFTRSWIWCGRLCDNYELLFHELYQQECVKHVQNYTALVYRLAKFEKIWDEIINTSMSELEHDMDYERCRFEYKRCIDDYKELLFRREAELDHMKIKINSKETSLERQALYERIRVRQKSISNIKSELRILTRKYHEIEDKNLSEEEKEKMRNERKMLLNESKKNDWVKCHEKRDELNDELNLPEWLDREVLDVYKSIDSEEIEGTTCISVEGITVGKYWFSAEMARDKQMQKMIAKYAKVEYEKG